MKWQYSVGEIIRDNWRTIKDSVKFNSFQLYHLNQLQKCRTAALGGHVHICDDCEFFRIAYNSCRNRHCPTCQGLKREEWIFRQETNLLQVPYFHVVFTLPSELNGLCLAHPRLMYAMLFRCAWQTIQAFAKDPKFLGAKTGMTSVLHTWGQAMTMHPHLHCIIPGGGITRNRKWKNTRSKGKYLFPRNALRKVFKGKFCSELKKMAKQGDIELSDDLREKLYHKKWVVYAKRPFVNPKAVIEYLGRYTHKVAISNYRIQKVNDKEVTFEWKNYKKGGEKQSMLLPVLEFLRRFCLHLLPDRFQRIRHYGILSSRGRSCYIPDLQLGMGIKVQEKGKDEIRALALNRMKISSKCPCCAKGNVLPVLPFGRDGPPDESYIFEYIIKR